ncbi:MAG: hypothetical protein SCAL_000071 [Candidatus Syntrophoarchaeum caldarius]|uniref:Uncharacterized protein n=1 Tax=Candidatus Syntropharchaeum caldarium TaxID=1838285 RepID=A0A1F2PBG7_9EURY|nr:MAG: hypothetical protein SCAL_000071 [Candidatus Syntrophoarchaeum caldarius]
MEGCRARSRKTRIETPGYIQIILIRIELQSKIQENKD